VTQQKNVTPLPVKSIKFVPVTDLTPEETSAIADLGLNVQATERVVTDLKERMDADQVDANTANQMALDEEAENDRLSTVHPDVAAALRETMNDIRISGRESVNAELNKLDEDYQDTPQEPEATEKQAEKKSDAEAENPFTSILREQAKQFDARLDNLRKKITDDDRNAILNEVIRKIPFAKTYSFWNGKISVVLSTISTKRRIQLQKVIATTVNETGPLTAAQYDSYLRFYDSCCSLQMLTVNGNVVYVRDDTCSIDALITGVSEKGPLSSEWMRGLVVTSYREFRDFLTVLVQEASRDVFIDPANGDTGSTL
jgi:hypothetical protein